MSQTATLTEIDIGDGAIELGHRPGQESKTAPVARELRETETALQDESPPPTNARHEVERWNWPRGNVPRLGFAFLSFIIAGMNDAAIGVCTALPA